MISSHVSYTSEDFDTIATHFPVKSKDWERGVYSKLQENIKKHYCKTQKKMCAYCQTELEQGCHSEHIEHIVAKEFKPHWMFEPINLVIACSQCNTKKGTQNVLTSYSQNAIIPPVGSGYYIIIHPHFDDFNKHIEIEDGLFIKARDNYKGQNTIEICGLWRPLYVDRRAKHLAINMMDREYIALYRAEEIGIPASEKQAFLDYADEIIGYL